MHSYIHSFIHTYTSIHAHTHTNLHPYMHAQASMDADDTFLSLGGHSLLVGKLEDTSAAYCDVETIECTDVSSLLPAD